MRRPLPLPALRRDTGATAPYAVVAVIILLGAGMSYAYLAHLNASRLRMEGLEPWSEGAMDALDREEARFRAAVSDALALAVHLHDGASSVDLVSSIGRVAQDHLSSWAASSYPRYLSGKELTASPPRLSLSTVYGTVLTGNVLGQQTTQRAPVGMEAVGAVTVAVGTPAGGIVSRDVAVRVHRTEPMVLAAHLQNVLEYSLADEGLVPRLMADGLSSGLSKDPGWVPDDGTLGQAVDVAIGVVERSLFHWDTGVSAMALEGGDLVSGTTLLGPGEQGQVLVPLPSTGTVTVRDARAAGPTTFRLVPWVEWRAREVDLRTDRLWSAEAGGPGGAVVAHMDMAGRFGHRVDAWSGDVRLGSVSRDIEFRDHLVAWAEDPTFASGGGRRMGKAQVEDWERLRATMDVVSPPCRQVTLDIAEGFGSAASVSLDGVHLGLMGPGEVLLENVVAGRHQLTVRSDPGTGPTVGHTDEIDVPPTGPVATVAVAPRDGADPEAAYAFWFSVMAALQRSGASPLAHLEHIATLVGYGPLPPEASADPRAHLEEVTYWVEGLDHHLDFRGGNLEDKGDCDPLGTWRLAKEVVSLSKLTFKLVTKLPDKLVGAGQVVVELSGSEGRAAFLVRVQGAGETIDLVEAAEEADGGCRVVFNIETGVLVERAGNMLSALSIIGKSLTIGFDAVELRDATQEGNGTAVAWAVYDLGVDLAQIVLSAVKFACDLGVLVLSRVTQSVLAVIGSAISVVASFLDAYRDAGSDFWGAWELLLTPDTFGDALRTAGFLSAMASLVTTVVVTAALPMLAGVSVAAALSMAVVAASGVGLIVLAAVLAIWAIFHWEEVACWVHGSVTSDDVDRVERDVSDVLGVTLRLMANLNTVDAAQELADARMERAVGLALMDLRTTCGDGGLVEALAGTPHYHLDGGSAQGRRARAVVEARHWIVVLWRQVDDLVDDDHAEEQGSEGFPDDGGIGKDHDFDGQVRIKGPEGSPLTMDAAAIVAFLEGATVEGTQGWSVRLVVEGDLFKDALGEWVSSLEAIGSQLAEATRALSRSSRETTFAASSVSEAAYDRSRGLVEVRVPAEVASARVMVECLDGAVIVDGEPVTGPVLVHVHNGTALLAVTGRSVVSDILTYTSDDQLDMDMEATCAVSLWSELSFGGSLLEHALA